MAPHVGALESGEGGGATKAACANFVGYEAGVSVDGVVLGQIMSDK